MELIIAWVVGICMTAGMVGCGIQNRRSGWKRRRDDVILDSLMTWASWQHEEDQRRKAAQIPTPATTATGLGALAAAVGTVGMGPANARVDTKTAAGDEKVAPAETAVAQTPA